MTTHRKLAVGALATLGLAALPASAGAIGAGTPISESPFAITTTTSFQPCYSTVQFAHNEVLKVVLTGGTPGDSVTVTASTAGVRTGTSKAQTFDANGDATLKLGPIRPKFRYGTPVKGAKTTIIAKDLTAGTVKPVSTFLMTQDALEYSGYRLGGPASLSLSGMFGNEPNYIFVTNPSATQVISEFKLPRANSCGYTRGSGVFFHATHETVGTYHIFVWDKPTLNKKQAWEYKLPVTNP